MSDFNPRDVLDFWFGAEGSPEYGTFRDIWFRAATPAFDQEIRDKFLAYHEAAASGALDAWAATWQGTLALLVLLDQFPRNMFRGTARAFATDHRAQSIAKRAVAKGLDRQAPEAMRLFFYLPFEHSEDLDDQERGIALFTALGGEQGIKSSIEHRDTIKRFGRFPHRNAVLGRQSTAEEVEYLKTGQNWGQGAPAKAN
jgi:uncharacterized protein (DUF924 family)